MILVDASGLTMSRPDRPLFSDVSLTISSGDRIAVVGVNGTGKSTLLDVLAGRRLPEAGTVRRGRAARVSVLHQDDPLPAGTVGEVSGSGWEADAIRDRLDLAELVDRPTDQLSGGQAKRTALARALLGCGPEGGGPPDDADLLILDEPTNHLDIAAIAWLEEWLSGFRGGLVMVSHDRHVLDRVCNRMVELDRGAAHVHDGGYASYLADRAERTARDAAADAKRRNLARAELAWLRRGAPARSSKPKARVESATALVEGAPSTPDVRSQALDLHLGTPRLGDKVIEARGIGARVEGRSLFDGVDLLLDRRERLGIVGPNGAGKTTLLNILAGRRAPDSGAVDVGPTARIGTFTQDGAELDPARRVRDLVAGDKKEASWIDAALLERFWFDPDTQYAPVGTLSGGERRRLQLLLTLQAEPNVLFLDEPTNDLDLDTLRVLEDYLEDWPGALVIVSHDRALLERMVVDVLILDGHGGATRRPGGLATYLDEMRAGRVRGKAAGPSVAPSEGAAVAGGGTGDDEGGETWTPGSLRKAFNAAQRRLRQATEDRDRLRRELEEADPADHRRLHELGQALSDAEGAVGEAEEIWLELASVAEEVNPGLL